MRRALAIGMATAMLGMAQEVQSTAALPVRVYNIAKAPPGKVARALAKAADIFRRHGIRTNWMECPSTVERLPDYPECGRARGRKGMVITLVPNGTGEQSLARLISSRHSLGFALFSERGRPTWHAWVLTDRVVEQAKVAGAAVSTLLAYAMVHEIGHLLLGQGSHTSSGIMTGFWNGKTIRNAETGKLGFSKRQEREMLADVRRRVERAAPRRRGIFYPGSAPPVVKSTTAVTTAAMRIPTATHQKRGRRRAGDSGPNPSNIPMKR